MRTSIVLSAILSTVAVSALPTFPTFSLHARSETCDKSPADGRGATLFKKQNLDGENTASDYTPIPSGEGCIDLSSMYGAWEGKTRSLVVNKGYTCEFYTEAACPSTQTPLCLGSTKEQTIKKTLSKDWDSKIYSVKCSKSS